jgi:hypothetical protein
MKLSAAFCGVHVPAEGCRRGQIIELCDGRVVDASELVQHTAELAKFIARKKPRHGPLLNYYGLPR